MFKLVCALLGFYFFGFFGSLIGYFLGGIVDRSRAYGIGGINPLSSGNRQKIFLKTVFTLLGKLAKADGHISKEEIAHVEQLFQKLRLSAEHKQNAITQFKQGSEKDFDIDPILKEFMEVCGRTHQLRQMLLVYLIVMALSDGSIESSEERLLIGIAYQLGYDEAAFRQLLDMVLNQLHFAGGQAVSATAVEDAYNLLDVNFTYNVNDNLSVRANINNLFDKEPPIVGDVLSNGYGNTISGFYDTLGMYWNVTLNATY